MNKIYHYCGHIIAENERGRFPASHESAVIKCLDDFLEKHSIDSCFGSMASGADILIAHSVLLKGAKLNCILPFDRDFFLQTSVLNADEKWRDKFTYLVKHCQQIVQIYYSDNFDANKSYALCSEVAMGLALLQGHNSRHSTELEQLAIWDGELTQLDAGTYPDLLRWQLLGNKSHYVSSQRPIKHQAFSSESQVNCMALDLIVYAKNPKDNRPLKTIDELLQFFESVGETDHFHLDFNREIYGVCDEIKFEKISQRALGHIIFHFALAHSKKSLKVFIDQLLKYLNPKITRMDTETFSFEEDLLQLAKVNKVNATAAIVFYTGRILEASSNYCIKQFDNEKASNVFSNIEFINDFNLLDYTTRYWAHALRRLSNQYRHMLKATENNDGQLSVILLDAWLNWLINKSPLLKSRKRSFSLLNHTHKQLNHQFQLISHWIEDKSINEFTEGEMTSLLKQAVFASIIIEELINKKEMPLAYRYLTIAQKHNPVDLRLLQLEGLYFSRNGELKKAEIRLKKVMKLAPNDDETIGILAGVIKKIWQNGDQTRLKNWGNLYLKGWKLSKHKNTYLGINAASYCLWSNNSEKSQSIARDIINTYEKRKMILKERFDYKKNEMDYWDQATLAEAYLLSGNKQKAQETYQVLFALEEYTNMPHEIAANQLKLHLNYLSLKQDNEFKGIP